MKRTTRADLLLEVARYSKESGVAFRCLNAVINGDVEWFGLRPYRLGIVNPCGPEGGMIIVKYDPRDAQPVQKPYSTAYLWEEWWPDVRDWTFHSLADPTKDERFKLRELAMRANDYILNHQRQVVGLKIV